MTAPVAGQAWKRNAALFLASQAVSLTGSALVQFAMLWQLTLETGSGSAMTLFVICGFLPTLVLSPFAGVWADRYNRKLLIVFSDALIAGATLIMALVFMSGFRSWTLFFAVAAVRSFGSAVQGPAVGAILPQMVPQEHLTRVNGINGTIQSANMLVAPMLSGALLSVMSLEHIFFIDVGTALVAIVLLVFFLKVAPHQREAETEASGYLGEMLAGFRYIRNHRYLIPLFVFYGILMFLVTPGALLSPLQVTRSFGPDVWRLTAIEVVFSAGMLAGGILISVFGGFRNRIKTMVISNLVMAICTLGLGFAPWFVLYLVFMGIFGLVLPYYNTPGTVLLQEQVEEAYLGRVFSVLTMLSTSLMPVGMLLFGPLADTIRIEWLMIGTGSLLVFNSVWPVFFRRLREAGRPLPGGA